MARSRRCCPASLTTPPKPAQIGHAGDGGLYAEMVQDRSFDALAAATGFLTAPAARQPLDLPALAARHRHPMQPLQTPWVEPGNRTYSSKREYLEELRRGTDYDPVWVARGLGNSCWVHHAARISLGCLPSTCLRGLLPGY